eukprot:jgi/Botrbrau1/1695/Bobra.116_2s0037.1
MSVAAHFNSIRLSSVAEREYLQFATLQRENSYLRVPVIRRRRQNLVLNAYKVEIEGLDGKVSTIEVKDHSCILETALEKGLKLSHDCKMGVCMTCPAKLVSGQVDQSAGMLDEAAIAKGYTLLCVAEPQSDCRLKIITEDELLEEVLCSQTNVG